MTYGAPPQKKIPNHGILVFNKETRTGNEDYKHKKHTDRPSFILAVSTLMTAIMCLLVPPET